MLYLNIYIHSHKSWYTHVYDNQVYFCHTINWFITKYTFTSVMDFRTIISTLMFAFSCQRHPHMCRTKDVQTSWVQICVCAGVVVPPVASAFKVLKWKKNCISWQRTLKKNSEHSELFLSENAQCGCEQKFTMTYHSFSLNNALSSLKVFVKI